MRMKRRRFTNSNCLSQASGAIFFLILGALVLFPAVYTLCNSFMSPSENSRYYAAAMGQNENAKAAFHLIPDAFSLEGYYMVFLRSTDYLMKFWRSLFLCLAISAGQIAVSALGGFAFAKYPIPLKKGIYFLLMALMMMPVQVTLVPNYIILDELKLLDTWLALILPMMFLPFGTVFMTQIFKGIPDELLDAAKLDGAGTLQSLFRVMAPIGKGGFISVFLLSFVDAWNMVEQPITFLKDILRYPLSVFLASVNQVNFELSFVCGVLAALPMLLLFFFFHEELTQGIELSGVR
ncbi:carbohydrate ABC transporter permease [Petralouisia muris]|uniref:Carbohydrate ABC transporter permease n=1 Tax=Petralouisia muris TaxID=3032872 RepID=A0AC61RUN7_9FIRM|nr:carbohydrate ABC transporter permease [Petralouisia muris]